MKIGGKMEVTREFFAPVIIKIDRITELELLMDLKWIHQSVQP